MLVSYLNSSKITNRKFFNTCRILSLFLSSRDSDAPEKFKAKEEWRVCPSIADAAEPVNEVLITWGQSGLLPSFLNNNSIHCDNKLMRKLFPVPADPIGSLRKDKI